MVTLGQWLGMFPLKVGIIPELLTLPALVQTPVRSPAVGGQDPILEASAHDDGHIDMNNTQPTARTDSQAHDSTVGNPVRMPVMDCSGNYRSVAGNVPLESGEHPGANDLTYAGVVQNLSVILRLVDGTPCWKHRHMMDREIRLVLKIFISLIIIGLLVQRQCFAEVNRLIGLAG